MADLMLRDDGTDVLGKSGAQKHPNNLRRWRLRAAGSLNHLGLIVIAIVTEVIGDFIPSNVWHVQSCCSWRTHRG